MDKTIVQAGSCSFADLAAIRAGMSEVQEDSTLLQPERFSERAEAIDFLEFHILDRIEGMSSRVAHPELAVLKDEALQIKALLEQADRTLFRRLRSGISTGMCKGPSLWKTLRSYLAFDTGEDGYPGYDHADTFLNGLLSRQPLPEATLERESGMIFYQQTPARIMMQLIAQAAFTDEDVFFDLGSGLGQVGILVHLLTGVAATGIEYEPAYCRYAAACTAQLNLPAVTFINQDARNADYSKGTVFFMYTPFEGNMLQQVLALLKKEARERTIRVFTYGSCSATVARQSWLSLQGGRADDPYTLCQYTAGPA